LGILKILNKINTAILNKIGQDFFILTSQYCKTKNPNTKIILVT